MARSFKKENNHCTTCHPELVSGSLEASGGPGSRTKFGMTIYIIIALALFGCGNPASVTVGESVYQSPSLPDTPSVSDPEQENVSASSDTASGTTIVEPPQVHTIEEAIHSNSYAGYLVMHIDESLHARLSKNSLYGQKKQNSEIFSIQSVIDKHSAALLKRNSSVDPDLLDSRRQELERLSGKKLPDLNSVYRIEMANPDEAEALYKELKEKEGVANIYPKLKPILTSIETTPDLTSLQGYLFSNETHGGLNAKAAWDRGVHGEGVVIVDGEDAWNFDHRDLPIYDPTNPASHRLNALHCETPQSQLYCPIVMAHGTAVVGILGGLNNGHGITGLAYGADIYTGSEADILPRLTDGQGDITTKDELPPGSVYVAEFGYTGAFSGPVTDWPVSQYGSLPADVDQSNFDIIRYAIAAGITIVEAADNGAVNLDDPNVYYPGEVNLTQHDSGSIIVGASEGPNHIRAGFSTCGSPVDTYAWGTNVVTASFDDGTHLWYGNTNPSPPNDDPNAFFTNVFSGTSASVAIVGGAVALVQSYAKRELGEGATRYLMPLKMRELIVNSGVSQEQVQAGAPYNVCAFQGGVHTSAGSCSNGWNCNGYPADSSNRRCIRNEDCWNYGNYFELSPECVNGRCGMSWCSPTCSQVSGGCAAMGWEEVQIGTTCYCRPPFQNELTNCNIGKQPRVDVAMVLVDDFVTQIKQDYPELQTNTPFTKERFLQLRQLGVGIVCKKVDLKKHILPSGDPSCPDEELWPEGQGMAKDLDFDGDGRADLVQWTNGTLKIDLSGIGNSEDNFGEWNLEINYPPIEGKWVWPYVSDMNSDGREDLVVYDKEHGKWYIKFTTTDFLNTGEWTGWGKILDYSGEWKDDLKLDPNKSNYSRPEIGDYDGDGWNDIAIACSDGKWRIDTEVRNRTTIGTYNRPITYLSSERLRQAPGWAYLTTVSGLSKGEESYIHYKVPDGLVEEGRVVAFSILNPGYDFMEEEEHFYGGNDSILLPGIYGDASGIVAYGLKNDGDWTLSYFDLHTGRQAAPISVVPFNVYGDETCHPIVADFDGDDNDDRVVMCPDEWRISYSSHDNVRRILLTYDPNIFTLPGRSYSGGVSYSYVKEIISLFQELHPNTPPPIPVDMVTTH